MKTASKVSKIISKIVITSPNKPKKPQRKSITKFTSPSKRNRDRGFLRQFVCSILSLAHFWYPPCSIIFFQNFNKTQKLLNRKKSQSPNQGCFFLLLSGIIRQVSLTILVVLRLTIMPDPPILKNSQFAKFILKDCQATHKLVSSKSFDLPFRLPVQCQNDSSS